MSAEYRIGSLADFTLIPPDRIDACLADFATWLRLFPAQAEINSSASAMFAEPVALVADSFIWADDGIAGLTAFVLECDGVEIGRLPVGAS